MDIKELRPQEVMDNWLTAYGYDKNRSTSPESHSLGYVLTINEGVPKWRMFGAEEVGEQALMGTFRESLALLSNDYKAGRFGEETTRIGAVLLVSHGTGHHAYKNPETGENLRYEELTEGQKEELAKQFEDDGVREELEGEVPCRIVNVITPTGLAADVSIVHKTGVVVQQIEQYLNDGEGTIPQPCGAVDDALMSTFMFMQVARECVASGEEMSFAGMLKTATELHDMQGGKQLIAFLLRILAGGLEEGIISLGEDDD
jgi:hypothetical protein